MEANQNNNHPIQSWKFWGLITSLFIGVMALTLLKDWWLTKEAPNIVLYIFVPILSILGGVLSVYGVVKISKQSTKFITIFAISLGVNTLMQVIENIMKVTYHLIWEYPGILYIAVVIPLGFLLMVYGLVRWGQVQSWLAWVLSVVDFVGSMFVGVILTEVLGLTTPGS